MKTSLLKKFGLTMAAAILAIGAVPSTSLAVDVPALTFADSGLRQSGAGFSIGYTFTLSTAVTVTSLGFFDDATAAGLLTSHDVGIFSFTNFLTPGALLFSGTVASGTTDPLIAGFRYATLATPETLAAGTYVIAGTTSADPWAIHATAIVGAPGFTYGTPDGSSSGFAFGNTLNDPTNYYPTGNGDPNSYFGPNFTYATPSVPEPSTVVLSLLGLSAAFVYSRVRRSRS